MRCIVVGIELDVHDCVIYVMCLEIFEKMLYSNNILKLKNMEKGARGVG